MKTTTIKSAIYFALSASAFFAMCKYANPIIGLASLYFFTKFEASRA